MDQRSYRRVLLSLLLVVLASRAPARAADEVEFAPGDFSQTNSPGLFLLPADGGKAEPLGCFPQFDWIGSPAYSPDGKWIAFDGARNGGDLSTGEIVLLEVAAKKARSLGDGLMPTWHPDGKRIACSRYENGSGAWFYDLEDEGKPKEIERGAWGVQWSPDGKYWAYSLRGSLLVKNAKSGQIFEYPYSASAANGQAGWTHNFTWSPDSNQICGVVGLENGQPSVMILKLNLPRNPPAEAGPLEIRQGEFQLVLASVRPLDQRDMSWHPRRAQVVLTLLHEPLGKQQLFAFNPQTGSVPWLLPEQLPVEAIDHCWSPDGKNLLCVGQYHAGAYQ